MKMKKYLVTVKKNKEVVYTATVSNTSKRDACFAAEQNYICKQIKRDVANYARLRYELLQSLKSTAVLVG